MRKEAIRRLHKLGISQSEIARRFGVSRQRVGQIVHEEEYITTIWYSGGKEKDRNEAIGKKWKEKMKAIGRKHYKRNRAKRVAYSKAYYRKNIEKYKEYQKKYKLEKIRSET